MIKTVICEDVFEKGEWKKCITLVKGQLYGHTRAYTLWKSINRRCKEDGIFVDSYPSYKGVENKFLDFQDFAGWATVQFGYTNREVNGNYWSIDKDISGVRDYCKQGCLFVPNYINSSVLDSKRARGNLPIGVVYRNKNSDMVNELRNCYGSSVKKDGKRIHCGYYDSPEGAHRAWQKMKIEVLMEYCTRHVVEYHTDLKRHLTRIIRNIKHD